MSAKAKKKPRRFPVLHDRFVYLALILASVLIRLPFLRAFDLVAYDGTYYINQARAFWGAAHTAGAFPIGYPALIALLLPLVPDSVRAAQIVSFAASLGSVCLLYALGKKVASRAPAFLSGLLFALTPLFVRFSIMTMSESLCIFWTLLGMFFFASRKDLYFGLSMGMAAITRPEVLGVFGVLAILRRRPWRRLVPVLGGFLVLYSVNLVVLSSTLGEFVLLPKTGAFGASVSNWKGREVWGEFSTREKVEDTMRQESPRTGIVVDYVKRFPGEIALLGRHVMPMAFLLALYGIFRRRLFLLAGFVPFIFFPIFADRVDPRYVLPYVPMVFLYAAVGLENIGRRHTGILVGCLLVLSTAVGLGVNRDQLTRPVSDGFQWAKKSGIAFRNRVESGDKVADRKPFFAFYAGVAYVEIPVAPYDEAVQYLLDKDVRFLSLHKTTIDTFRPALRPLLYDRELINGEVRLDQVYEYPEVQIVYERVLRADPLQRRRVSPPLDGVLVAPSWSPNGEMLAYRVIGSSGESGIFIIPPAGGQPQRVIGEEGMNDPLTWSPDSKRIAFATSSGGNTDIYAYGLYSGELERLTRDDAADVSPSWSADGKEILFCSDRSGGQEIWSKNLETGELAQITTDGGNGFPALSPAGDRIAWIRDGDGIVILDRVTGQRTLIERPRQVSYAPAWSPDGRFIAVTGEDWEGANVYLVTSDGSESLLLTKSSAGDGMPCWSPDGRRMAVVTNEGDNFGLWVLSGLEAYTVRLESPVSFRSFEPPR